MTFQVGTSGGYFRLTRLFHLLKQLVAAMFQDFGLKHCPDHNNQKKAVHSSCKEEMPKHTVEA
jgi:hypothetical protein